MATSAPQTRCRRQKRAPRSRWHGHPRASSSIVSSTSSRSSPVPPFDTGGQPGDACAYPVCFINGTLLPATARGLGPRRQRRGRTAGSSISVQLSLTDTLLTMFIITVAAAGADAHLHAAAGPAVPGSASRTSWSGRRVARATSRIGMGGPRRARYVPIFAGFFVLILAFNWSGLVPPIGRVEYLRAPTSDVNVTIGLALVAFFTFQVEGFRRLGCKRLPGQVLPVLRVQERHRRGRHRPVRGPRSSSCSSSSSRSRCRCDSSATSTAARSPWASSRP